MDNLESIRKYYSTFINSISKIVKSYGGKVLKNIGDCILFYFPKTSDINDVNSFQEAIECDFKILDERYKINDYNISYYCNKFGTKFYVKLVSHPTGAIVILVLKLDSIINIKDD